MRHLLSLFTVILIVTACVPSSATRLETETPNVVEPGLAPTLVPAPTLTSPALSVQDNTFSLQSMNTVLPDDIIQEVGLFGGMGGGGSCFLDYSAPQLETESQDVGIMHSVDFVICGLGDNETINVSLTDPIGAVKISTIHSQKSRDEQKPSASFSYVPDYRDPTGIYQILFDGAGWQLSAIMNVRDAPTANLYQDEGQIIFYKFIPQEVVRLFAYDDNKMLGWAEYKMDERGELVITSDAKAHFVALGEQSGQANVFQKGGYIWHGVGDIYCPGAPDPIGLVPYQYAEVIVDSVQTFDYKGNVKGNLPRGTLLRVTSNATCRDSAWLWALDAVDDSFQGGYVQEGDANQAFLRPLAELPATPSPVVANPAAVCPGSLPTRLMVGLNAKVTTSGLAPQLILRAQPGMLAEQVHVIAAGRGMVILEGPICADQANWWRIRSEQGFEGWVREGDNEDYWIDRLP